MEKYTDIATMKERAKFNGLLRTNASDIHPLQSTIEFIFTDFSPNRNKQGVPRTEADNILRTGMYMPIKVQFAGDKVGGHTNAIPIGPIVEMSQREDKIIGRAVIWKDEFPDFISYLEKASASEGGVQFSWELYYKDAAEDTTGIKWLTDCVVAGIAIVGDPAYAGRTPLLSFAEANDYASRILELERRVDILAPKGNTSMAETELETRLDTLNTRVGVLEASAAATPVEETMTKTDTTDATKTGAAISDEELATLKNELATLQAFKQKVEADAAKAELLATRRAALQDIIAQADFDQKADFIAGLTDDQFTAYTETLAAVAKQAKSATATVKTTTTVSGVITPDPLATASQGQTITVKDIALSLRNIKKLEN